MKNKKIILIFLVVIVVFTSFSALSTNASAWSLPNAGSFVLTNTSGLPFTTVGMFCASVYTNENVQLNTMISNPVLGSLNIVIVEDGKISIQVIGAEVPLNTINDAMLDDGVYCLLFGLISDDGIGFVPTNGDLSYRTYYASNEGALIYCQVVNQSMLYTLNMFDANHDGEVLTLLLYDMGTYFNSVGDTPTECPTLQDQIQDYNGTWAEFQGMMSTNSSLYEDFLEQKRIAYNDGIDVGQRDIINSINADNDFLSLMDTFLNYGMNNTRNVIDEQMDLVYQNGIDRGIEEGYSSAYDDGYEEGTIVGGEIGYNRGYQSGYNKGVSDEFVGGFFTNMLNAPINILNGIVIYQISDGGTPLDKTDDVNITVWGVLVVAVIISLFLILLKIFAGG